MIYNDEYFMNIALKEAKKAFRRNEVPVGAIIVKNEKIIAKGYNKREFGGDVTKHAELIAIKKASRKIKDWRLNECVMYVTLYPCSMCASAIIQSRMKKIVIGAPCKDLKNTKIVDMIFKDEKDKSLIEIKDGVLKEECLDIIQEFFRKQRKK